MDQDCAKNLISTTFWNTITICLTFHVSDLISLHLYLMQPQGWGTLMFYQVGGRQVGQDRHRCGKIYLSSICWWWTGWLCLVRGRVRKWLRLDRENREERRKGWGEMEIRGRDVKNGPEWSLADDKVKTEKDSSKTPLLQNQCNIMHCIVVIHSWVIIYIYTQKEKYKNFMSTFCFQWQEVLLSK